MDRTVGSILRAHMAIFNPAQASEAAQKLREAGLAAAEQAKRAAAAAGEMVSSQNCNLLRSYGVHRPEK